MTSLICHSNWLKTNESMTNFFSILYIRKHAINNFLINDLMEFNQRGTKSIVLIEVDLE